jgi:hypothetical protein
MKAAKTKPLVPRDFFAALIRTAYFPQELPPAITTKYFADFCRVNYPSLNAQKNVLLKRTTNFETFTAPRLNLSRRNFAMVHPISQAALSLQITEHRNAIKSLITKSGTSLYVTREDPLKQRAFLGLDFRKWDVRRTRICSEFPFVLQADISRFFYTVYTHSIPWAVIGKSKVKKWLATGKKHRLDNHWSNNFDRALQSCHSRETFGIPAGPDTSRIIAEILLAGIEKDEAILPHLKNGTAFRLLDDYFIGFDEEENAQKTLVALRSALWRFNLQLNEEKTRIVSSREIFRKNWERDGELSMLWSSDGAVQEKQIYRLLDSALEYCQEARSDLPAIRACVRFAGIQSPGANFPIILDSLFRLAREFPRCTSHVVSFLINNQSLCHGIARERTIRWIRKTLKKHFHHGHDFEVSWCFVACAVIGIKIRKEDISITGSVPNSVLLALLGLLREKGLLEVPLSYWPWRSHLKTMGIYSEGWLPYYEAVRRKWTLDKKMISVIKADSTLAAMLKADVTFLEDDIFQAGTINLKKRTFKKGKPLEKKPLPWSWANIADITSIYD